MCIYKKVEMYDVRGRGPRARPRMIRNGALPLRSGYEATKR